MPSPQSLALPSQAAKRHELASRQTAMQVAPGPQKRPLQSRAPLQSIWHDAPARHVTLQSSAPAQPTTQIASPPQVTPQSRAPWQPMVQRAPTPQSTVHPCARPHSMPQ
jgi:hypothetical protein